MSHDTALIATIAGGIGLAFVFGLLATRLRLPPLVGYILAGVVLGPGTPGFAGDIHLAQQLAEVGVILLMFGVGIHFSVADLLAVRRIALPGALVQISIATLLGLAAAYLWGWPLGTGIVFGLCLSVASTVVLLRAMESRNMIDTLDGRIAVGWLIVEDLVTVLVLVLLPALAVPLGGSNPAGGGQHLFVTISVTFAKVGAFVALMYVVGRRVVPWLLERVARTGSREMFTLAVLAVALGIAFGAAALFDVSFALGAFFAGMVVNGSDLSHEAAEDALPLQDAFSVLFFVAVGMLLDPQVLVREPLAILAVVAIVMVGKSLAAFGIVLAFHYPVRTALTISASLAQIGEFSFILAALAMSLGLLPREGQSLIVAGAILSIALNPVAFWLTDRLSGWLERHPKAMAGLERRRGDLPEVSVGESGGVRDHAIIVGYGRVGYAIGEILVRSGIPFIAIDDRRDRVVEQRERGRSIVFGDAGRAAILEHAHPERARLLVTATPDPYKAGAIIERARAVNPGIACVARAHSDEARQYLVEHGADVVLVGEHELAFGLAHQALIRLGQDDAEADHVVDEYRREMPSTAVH